MSDGVRTLAIDVGGTGLKMIALDDAGVPLSERTRVLTPRPAEPGPIVDALVAMAPAHGRRDRVSVGFPGVVLGGVVSTAPNLDGAWSGFPLAATLEARLGCPVRVANDADVQGHGVIEGEAVELVLTLGTGMGASLFVDGHLVPNLEMGHHPFEEGRTYEESLGKAALEEVGKKVWNQRLRRALATLQALFNPRQIHIGGGNAKKVKGDLPPGVRLVDNRAGLLGGIALWRGAAYRSSS